MRPPPYTAPLPWRPLADDEYDALAPFLAPTGADRPRRGRPPTDRRAVLDAVFWVACSKGPWKALPPEFGVRPDTASRALRRWAAAGLLDRLLLALAGTNPLLRAPPALRRIGYWVCRAFRRMARRVGLQSVLLARSLHLYAALPCPPFFLPHPDLSEILRRRILKLLDTNPFTWRRAYLRALRGGLRLAGGRPRTWRLA